MKKRKGFAVLWAWVLCVALLAGMSPVKARAEYTVEKIDTAKQTSLELQYRYTDENGEHADGVPGIAFHLYQVAAVSDTCVFTLTGDFSDYAVDLDNPTADEWKKLVPTLQGFVMKDNIPAGWNGTTDAAGTVKFTGLPTGLYLVVGDAWEEGEERYIPNPFLISLPDWSTEQANWVYDVQAAPKTQRENGEEDFEYLGVVKRWADNGYTDQRPQSVTVELLRDGEVFGEPVVLSEANNWMHTWEELEGGHDYQVVETDVPSGYTVLVSEMELWFVVENTYHPPGGDNPGGGNPGGGNPGGGGPDGGTPNTPTTTTIVDEGTPLASFDQPSTALEMIDEDQVPLAMLPQTGLLWWPVPILTLCGMALFVLGWTRYQRDGDGGEQ